MATVKAIPQVAGAAMGKEIGLQVKMAASSADAQVTGHVIALQQVVAEEVVNSLFVLDLVAVVAVGIALEETVIDTSMIDMMEGAMGTGIVTMAETNMGAVIAMFTTGIHLVEIVLQGIGMEVQTVTRKMGMAKMEAMIGMEVQEGAATGMEVEGHHAMREEVTGIGQLLMTALGEEGAHLLSIATENFDFCCSLVNFSDACVYSW